MNLIGVTGIIGSGKSTFSKLISEKFGFYYLNTDKLFKDRVATDPSYINEVKRYTKRWPVKMFNDDGSYNRDIAEFLFYPSSRAMFSHIIKLTEFNSNFIIPAIMEELKAHENVLIESAILLKSTVRLLCTDIYKVEPVKGEINLTSNEWFNNLLNRDPHRHTLTTSGIVAYQSMKIDGLKNEPYKLHVIKNYNSDGSFGASEASLIKQFEKSRV